MPIFYCDMVAGNDTHDGLSWGTAKKTIDGACALDLQPGDSVRIAKSPDPVALPVANWAHLSRTVTFASAPTGLTTNHLLSKTGDPVGMSGDSDHEWLAIASIVGNVVALVSPYSGSTESVPTFYRSTVAAAPQKITKFGTVGNLLTFSGGWDTISNIQNGHTFFNGTGAAGEVGLYTDHPGYTPTTSNCYVKLDGMSFVKYYTGFQCSLVKSEINIGQLTRNTIEGIIVTAWLGDSTLNIFAITDNGGQGALGAVLGQTQRGFTDVHVNINRILGNGAATWLHHQYIPWVLNIGRIECNGGTADFESFFYATITIGKVRHNGSGVGAHNDQSCHMIVDEIAYNGGIGLFIGQVGGHTYDIGSIHDNGGSGEVNDLKPAVYAVSLVPQIGDQQEYVNVGSIYNQDLPLWQDQIFDFHMHVDHNGATDPNPVYMDYWDPNAGSTFTYTDTDVPRVGIFTVPPSSLQPIIAAPSLLGVQAGTFVAPAVSLRPIVAAPYLLGIQQPFSGTFTLPSVQLQPQVIASSLVGISIASGNTIRAPNGTPRIIRNIYGVPINFN